MDNKHLVEVTRAMKEKLDECPNCNGEIKQISSWKIRCQSCGYTYKTETQNERRLYLCFMVGLLSFGLGAILVSIL